MFKKNKQAYILCFTFLVICTLPGMSQVLKVPAVLYPSGTGPARSIVLADVNNDGKLDAIVTNSTNFNGSIAVMFGNGDGTFQTAASYPAVFPVPNSVAVADNPNSMRSFDSAGVSLP